MHILYIGLLLPTILCGRFPFPWSADGAEMDKHEVQTESKYLFFEGLMLQKFLSDMMQTLGDSDLTYSTDAKWHTKFQLGRTSCDDMHCHRCPLTSVVEETVEKFHNL